MKGALGPFMFHSDNHLLELVFLWSIISAWPALDEVTKPSCLFECGQSNNIVLYLLFQVFTSKVTDDMFHESIVQEVPAEVENAPDVHNGCRLWNVGQLFSTKLQC